MQREWRGEPMFNFRLPLLAQYALREKARSLGLSAAGFARAVVVASLTGGGEKSCVSQGDLHRNFDRAVKRFMLTYQMPVGVAGLPAIDKRNELEELSWAGLQEAIKFAKVQQDPELRLLAMRIVGYLIRVELTIEHEQDHAAVDDLFIELEALRDELKKKVQSRAPTKPASK
jgi:hypothetical protein